MNREYGLDPVSAISEAEATGDVAAIFADIRQTMQLPMLTSIWRTLAAIPDGLPTSWAAAKPLFQTGQPDAVLKEFRAQAQFPVPKPLPPGQLAGAAVPPEDLPAIRSVIAAYNRSNALNLIALTALISEPAGNWPQHRVPPGPPPWGTMPTLLTERDMEPETWRLIERVNRLGATSAESGVATLWRHLAHWPGLLAFVEAHFAPLQHDGTIASSVRSTLDFVHASGIRLAQLRTEPLSIPVPALQMIESYVLDPGKVARMVVIGHGLAHWIADPDK